MMPSRPWSPNHEPTTTASQVAVPMSRMIESVIEDVLDLIEWDQEVWPSVLGTRVPPREDNE